MKMILTAVALLALAGCAQVNTGIDYAADQKAEANDTYTKTWLLMACDQSLAGVRRSSMDAAFRKALLDYCLKEMAPVEVP